MKKLAAQQRAVKPRTKQTTMQARGDVPVLVDDGLEPFVSFVVPVTAMLPESRPAGASWDPKWREAEELKLKRFTPVFEVRAARPVRGFALLFPQSPQLSLPPMTLDTGQTRCFFSVDAVSGRAVALAI